MLCIAVRNMFLATFLRKAWLQSRFGPEHTEWGDSKIWFQITRLKLRYAGKELIRMPGETVKDGIITVLPGKKNVNAWLVWARNSRFRPRQLCTASGLHCRASKKLLFSLMSIDVNGIKVMLFFWMKRSLGLWPDLGRGVGSLKQLILDWGDLTFSLELFELNFLRFTDFDSNRSIFCIPKSRPASSF